ncbi:DUF1793-domain-containing protein [Aspergillus sclerotiicarbonarius CBS 121057]|uniref:DUF1793-domain-containing protein n=1 Tax=Aspergillus sclerotiicarbonarius (strain CBS 121057 / IBT 28362) TaxID=1448318 RepID=A0A319DYZ1_ASPSB|nr:DUF1793-domain-containing protein [Aspergillus sclerotiicarbonarius CBS 121057]
MYLDFSISSLFIGLLATLVNADSPRERDLVPHQPALPPSYPLAVRSPYLSTWMPSDQVETLPYAEPQFWAGQSLTWSVMARVSGRTYSLMGVKNPGENIRPAIVRSAKYTATHSIFTLSAGSTIFTLDFFSPISPSNYLRQSLPFSYLTVSVAIDGRWTGRPQNTTRGFIITGCTHVFSLGVNDGIPYSEADDMATWGDAVFASRPSDSSRVSFSSGKQGDVHDKNPPWVPGGIVALAHDLGTVDRLRTVTFAVGHPYTGFYRSQYPDTHHAVSHFLKDYPAAHHESWALDMEMNIQATKAGARQAYGGIEVTIPNDTLDTTDVLAFIKELSSDGNLNTVDVIMPAFPIYYTLDPDYIRLLLEPMMRYLAAGRWQKPYVIHDMGKHYPNAIGHDNQQAEPMPIEECGNLLVLVLAYYTDLLQGYADYLVDNGVDITEQLSSNDAAGALANETNLAIKAAVGIKAFGELTGRAEYSRIGQARADLFFTQGRGTDEDKTHFVLQYPDKPASWKIPYNLYPDVLLDLQTFPKAAYEMGSSFFKSVRAEYGVPLDNRQDWAKSDWNMWLAGTFDPSTRAEFVDDLWAFMTNGKHNWPFSDRYVATSAKGRSPGVPVLCRARPTVGGHFALMALQGPKSLQRAVSRNLAKERPRPHNFGPQGYPLPNGAVPSGPVPGAAPLLPNNGRIIQNGPVRVLCIADVRGNLKSLNELARQARADHIIHTGDFGFYDDTSLERIADKTLKHVAQYSPLLPENSIKQRFTPDQLPLSELPMLLDKRLTLDVPVYTVWGACEDYKVDKLHIIDEANSRLLDIGGVKLRLLGLGGAVGKTTIAGGQGTMWTTLLQMGELIDTANRVYDPSETRIFVTHASPAREGMLNQLSVTLKADFSISAGLHFRYGSSYNEFSVNPSLDHYRGKLAASKASFNDVWETVRGEVEAAISQNEAQKTLLDNALEVVNRMPTVANGGNPFGGPAAPGNAAGQVDESAFKNMWNFNLADAAFGFLVLEIEAGRIATEMRAQGFNFAHRTGKPQPGASAQAAPVPTAAAVNIPSPRVPSAAPQFGQAQPVAPRTALPQQQQPSAQQSAQAKAAPAAAPARTSPVPVIPKPATPQPASGPAAQPAAASPERTTEPNGTAQHEKISESPLPKVEKKQSHALFLSNVENEQAARDLFQDEDKAKIVRIEKWGKYNNHVVHFSSVDEAKAALDRQPAEHKKPSPAGQPRKPNVKFFEDRGGHRGNAGTWQGSNRGGNTSQRGYQSGGASDSETNRGRGFRGRGGGRGDRGSRGGRGGRGGFNKGAPTSDSGPGDKPAATGGDA